MSRLLTVPRSILGFKRREYDVNGKKCIIKNLIICPSLVIKATKTGNNIGRACSARGIESRLRRNFRQKPSRGKSH